MTPRAADAERDAAARACMLDRLADLQLAHGRAQAAERLSWQAAALRAMAVAP